MVEFISELVEQLGSLFIPQSGAFIQEEGMLLLLKIEEMLVDRKNNTYACSANFD